MITTDKDIQRYVRAMDFACDAHASQRYGTRPHIRHLAHVEGVLLRFNFSDYDLLAAAWLHDAIEDAGVTHSEIARRFGDGVALLVFAVTDGEGANRRERKAASYAKMIKYPKAIILKLADRVANTESSLVSGDHLIGMYRKEYPAFREKLYAASLGEANADCRTRVAALWSYLHDITVNVPEWGAETKNLNTQELE